MTLGKLGDKISIKKKKKKSRWNSLGTNSGETTTTNTNKNIKINKVKLKENLDKHVFTWVVTGPSQEAMGLQNLCNWWHTY